MSYPPHIHLPQIFLQIFSYTHCTLWHYTPPLLTQPTIHKYSLCVFSHFFAYPFHTNPTLLSHPSHYNPSFFSRASQTQYTRTTSHSQTDTFCTLTMHPTLQALKTFNPHDLTFCNSPCTLTEPPYTIFPHLELSPNPCPLSLSSLTKLLSPHPPLLTQSLPLFCISFSFISCSSSPPTSFAHSLHTPLTKKLHPYKSLPLPCI